MNGLPEVAGVTTGAGLPLAGAADSCLRIASIPQRGRVTTGGFVEYVRFSAAGDAPEFAASIVDSPAGPGGRRTPPPRMLVVWHGQRRVPGIDQGVWVRVVGAVSQEKGITTMYDPNYEILASKTELQDRLTTNRQVKSHLSGKATR
ncbi:hypothetical protein [Zhihengliuella salsuginis]|uniref:Uncharacterized protein n=1 Tax=Zhihengliuella salsuginis TaxID=578222 RepID=A0ABQ3GC02_9MICC|nr:hypothetical protein [Zhihengliuella salsuginis]GHD01200.1 hypothetical protein GCM10008096_05040 [Zhihengliuella salsuginis]